MRYISASNISDAFNYNIINANYLYAIPIELEDGVHTIDQIFMQVQFANIKVALYNDNSGYPGTQIISVNAPTNILVNNVFYNFPSSITLNGGRYWIVSVADNEAKSAFTPMISSLGLDINQNDVIVGYSIQGNYYTGLPLTFPSNAANLVGSNPNPLMAIRETAFIPSSGGSGISGVSGFSGYSGFSGISGFSGAGSSISCITVTADHAVAASDETILCDATLGSITIFLETALLINGTFHNIKKIDSSANHVIISAIGGQFVDGDSTQIITTKNDNATVLSNGTNWFII